ncbi:MAG: sigma-E factor negative regulatory protein [Gammaproteobacteria bacterium]|nr:sigma-E factor negative regulatory protein [Gammaproteobacteria bacterium]
MSEEKNEALSAFIDGEVRDDDGPSLLDDVLVDDSLSRRWITYHLIGDVIRQNAGARAEDGPAPANAAGRGSVSVIRSRRTAVLGPIGGLALAASVALVAILGIYTLSGGERGAVVQTAAVGAGAAQVPKSGPRERTVARTQVRTPAQLAELARLTWKDAAPGVATRLNGYLVTHNEYLANGMRGMHPYARIVAYDGQGN